jgi:hypothetical protein
MTLDQIKEIDNHKIIKKLSVVRELFCMSIWIKYFGPSSLFKGVRITPTSAADKNSQYKLLSNQYNYSLVIMKK